MKHATQHGIETARLKAWLLITGNTLRDYVDSLELLEALDATRLPEFASSLSECQERGPSSGPAVIELIERLAAAAPLNLETVDLRAIDELRGRGRALASVLSACFAGPGPEGERMKDPLEVLARSRALWNRSHLDLASDEILAQILDRGTPEDWRALYALMSSSGAALRRRALQLLYRVPTGRPWFWLAALQSLGETIDWSREPSCDPGWADI